MNLDIEVITDERKRNIGTRIKSEREKRGWSQWELGEKITNISGANTADGKTKSQGNISDWERGNRIPSLTDLLCLSNLFGCDLGYLMCDYDSKTYGEKEISAALGLSPDVINTLTIWNKWGMKEEQNALSILISDARYKTSKHRAILDLIDFFFSYKREVEYKQLWQNGQITIADTGGTIDIHALKLSDSTIESAILVEIQEALRALKHSDYFKQEGGNNG